MAQLVITVPDAVAQRVLDGFAGNYGYQAEITDPKTGETVPNPQTKMQFAKKVLREIVMGAVKAHETQTAARIAAQAASDAIDREITLS